MSNTKTLIELIDEYAETRHRCGCATCNAKTEAARKAVIEALSGAQALSAPATAADSVTAPHSEPWYGHQFKEVRRGYWQCSCGKAIAEAVPSASKDSYPPLPNRYAYDDDGGEMFTTDQMRAYDDADRAARAPADSVAAPAIGDELRDALVAVSAAIAERDDRAAQKMIREILAAAPAQAEQPDLTKLTERGAKAWAGVDAHGLRDGRWYMVDKDGAATLCVDEEDAKECAAHAFVAFPHMGPHRAVQLVEASTAGFTAADMATASAQGFRDGVASVAASAGWPKVSGVSRDEGHSQALLVFFAAEPTDDEMRAVHDTLAASPTPPAEQQAAPKAAPGEPDYSEKWDAELGRTAMRFVDRAGDVHPGIDDAETICAEFHRAMSEVIERMPHVQRMAAPQQEAPRKTERWNPMYSSNAETALQMAAVIAHRDAEAAPQQGPWGYARKIPGCGWGFCSKRQYEDSLADGDETKKLYATPQPAPVEQNTVPAEWLEQAYREGWAACRDAETIGAEAEDWAFGNSTANSRMIDAQQAAPQQEAQEPVAHDEDLLEQMYWDFDSQRKKTGEERLAFKGKMRSYASEFRRRSVGQMVFAQSVSDDMMNLADRLGSEFDDVDPRAWKHLLVYAPKAAPAQPAPQQEAQEPALFVSPKQLAALTDPDDPEGEHGRYLPARKTSKGLFTQPLYTAPQQEAQEPCQTCIAMARTVMMDQVSFDRKPDCYGIRQITNDEGVEEWEDIRTSPDVAREEANDMMATGRGEIYEVVPLWTTPQPAPAPLSEQIDKLERKLAIIAVVGVIDGHDVVRRESVLEIARRAALAAQGSRTGRQR